MALCLILARTNKSCAASLLLDLHGISELLSRKMLLLSITYIGYKKIIPNLMSLTGFCIFLFIFVHFFLLQISLGFGYTFIDLLHCVQSQVS